MNDEQNNSGSSPETNDTAGKEPIAPGNTPDNGNEKAPPLDDYYNVDHAKKDVLSTIGDGEMHDEGLVGEGEAPTDIQSSMERLSDEQDVAESHDSEQ